MAKSSTVNHSAFVLHSRPYRETSVLLDLFTRDNGRVSAIYRGGRKTGKSRNRSAPELFIHYDLGLFGRTDLKSVSHFEVDGNAPQPRLQGVQLFSGLYINELMYKSLHSGVAHADIFAAYCDVLLALRSTRNYEAHLRNFELRLLASLGYGLALDYEAGGQKRIDAELLYEYVAGIGFKPANRQSEPGSVLSGATIEAIASGQWQDKQVLLSLKHITQQALTVLLKGQPIKTREFLRKSSPNIRQN